MRILVAIPLGSAYAPVLENLIKFRGEHELSLAFLIADSNEEAISFAKNLNPEIMGRFNKIYRLIYEDRGWILENLSSARNFALDFAREKGFDALLFLDSDIRPPPDALENLLNVDSPIASGFCKFRFFYIRGEEEDINTYSFRRSGEEDFTEEYPKEENPFRVECTGAPCLLIRQPALSDTRLNFNIDNPYCGEDVNFCFKAKEAGYEILVHPKVYCEHENIRITVSKDEARKFKSIRFAYFMVNPKTHLWLCLRKVKRKHLWIPKLHPEAAKLLPKSYFEPVEKPPLLQTGPFEYTPIFGAEMLKEKNLEEQIEAIVYTPIKAYPLSDYDKLRTIVMSNLIYESFDLIRFFSTVTL